MVNSDTAKIGRLTPVSAAVIAALASMPAVSQDQTRSEISPAVIEEIIVNATRRDASIQDIPFNIAAVSGETLDRMRLSQLSELSRHVPGLILIDQGGRSSDRMTVRGLNVASLDESAPLFNSSGDTVATYVGDIPLYIDFRLRDMERVEVLLGPQGTLYGAGTLGGAIRYLPKAPNTTEWEATVSVSGYSMSESDSMGSDVWGMINAPLIPDRLALRASVSSYDDPGFIDYPYLVQEPGVSNPNPDFNDPADVAANLYGKSDANDAEVRNARVALQWDINDAVSSTLSYYYQKSEAGGRTANHVHALGTGRYEFAGRILEPFERENQLVSLEISADLGFAELVSATGISNYEDLGRRDQADEVLDLQYGYEDFPDFVDFSREVTEEDRINQELRLVSQSDSSWNWIAGAYYNDYEMKHTYNDFGPGYPEYTGVNRPDDLLVIIVVGREVTEQALFGEVSYEFNEQWQATLGTRYFDYESRDLNGSDFPYFLTAIGVYGPDDTNVATQSFVIEDSGSLFKFNTSYQINDDAMTYLTISEGYRNGGVNAFPRCPEDGSFLPLCLLPEEAAFVPDQTLNYEIGLRSTWLDDRVTFNAALFHIDWTDVQLEARSQNGGAFITVNGGDAETRGVEMTTLARFNDRWRGSFNYAYTRAKLTSDAPGAIDGEDGFSGDRLAGTPEHQLSAVVTYSRPIWTDWYMDIDYGITYTSDILTKVGRRNNGEILPGYSIHNVSAAFTARDRWTLRLFVDNLFDKYAETNVRVDPSFIRDVGVHPLRRYYRNVLRPRQYGIEVRYDFDWN